MASAYPRGGRSRGKSRSQAVGTFAEVQHKGAPHKPPPSDPGELLSLLRVRDRSKMLQFSATYYFSHELWLSTWHAALGKSDFAVVKSLRLFIQCNSIHACHLGACFLPDGSKVPLSKGTIFESVCGTRIYECAPKIPAEPSVPLDTSVQVSEEDCLEAALSLAGQGLQPAVLVLASTGNPGGGYMEGAGAQEENLCRRSSLWQCLADPFHVDKERKWSYPIPEFGAIYSPKVRIQCIHSSKCKHRWISELFNHLQIYPCL